MNSDTIVLEVIDALEAAGVPYMLVGSFSSNLYGVPRSTKDADFVVQLGETPITAITGRLSPGFSLEPQMSFETITGTYRYVVRHAASAFSIEFFQLSNDPHDIERFARRRKKRMAGRETYLPSAEDVIITKLKWSRHGKRVKDIEDVKSVISVRRAELDWEYLHGWCDIHGTRDLLASVMVAVPKEPLE